MSQTLDRALTILDLVAEQPRRTNEVAEFLDVHPSTALRLLHTLRRHGFVHENSDHSYRLGASIFRLGFQALEAIDLRTIARPYMEELNRATGETIHLGALEDDEVIYLDKVEATHRVRMQTRIGAISPLHCTGVAKAIIAFLPSTERHRLLSHRDLKSFTPKTITSIDRLEADLAQTRERGFALDEEENEVGIHCVAAPIMSGQGQIVGAFSITAPMSRVDRETLLALTPTLIAATKAVSRQQGWTS